MSIQEFSVRLQIIAYILFILSILWKHRSILWKVFMAFCPTASFTNGTYGDMLCLGDFIETNAFWVNGVTPNNPPDVSILFFKRHPLLCIRIGGPNTFIKKAIIDFIGSKHTTETRNSDDGLTIYAPTSIIYDGDIFEDLLKDFEDEIKQVIIDECIYTGPAIVYHNDSSRTVIRSDRDPEGVLLPFGMRRKLEDIINDYSDPKTSDRVWRTGTNSTCGFILYGPPGTGKNSITWLIAYIYRSVELQMFSPQAVRNGSYLNYSKKRGVVALHDIDRVISLAGDLEGKGKVRDEFDLNSLLSVLDGTLAGKMQIYVLTANDIDKIPEAVRSRCHEFYVGYPGVDNLVKAFEIYFDIRDDGSFRSAIESIESKDTLDIRKLHLYFKRCKGIDAVVERINELDRKIY